MSEETTCPRHPWLAAVILCLLPIAYVLSYAPVVKLSGPWTIESVPNWNGRFYPVKALACGTTSLPVYRPVDWLIDTTPLDRPLLAWADLWGVESIFREAFLWRCRWRGVLPSPNEEAKSHCQYYSLSRNR